MTKLDHLICNLAAFAADNSNCDLLKELGDKLNAKSGSTDRLEILLEELKAEAASRPRNVINLYIFANVVESEEISGRVCVKT